MAIREFWIQIENRPWDLAPHNIDRMTGSAIIDRDNINPVTITLTSPTGVNRQVQMFKPFKYLDDNKTPADALILRRYKPPQNANKSDAWTVPDDRKINSWDLNEPDPTDNGTMGTIPGPVLECNVGDKIIVHFRNIDNRTQIVQKTVRIKVPILINGRIVWIWRTFTINVTEPLPAGQRTHSLHPHGITFDPRFDGAYPLSPQDNGQAVTFSQNGQDETALWQQVNVANSKQGDRVPPNATFDYTWDTLGWPTTTGVWLYHDHSICDTDNVNLGAIGILVIHNPNDTQDILPPDLWDPVLTPNSPKADLPGGIINGPPITGGQYHPPVNNATYLQLYHSIGDAAVCINGRVYLGNTPTVLGGPSTLMRFGLIGMGDNFHTFHLHGHRWVLPGPDGNTPDAIKNSIQNKSVSQFEDTRTFGPANSFVFTIKEGSATFTGAPNPIGEWHMHCHVLGHMMMGMMGSLLVANDGQQVQQLPQGIMCPSMMTNQIQTNQVNIIDFAFQPSQININKGQKVMWMNTGSQHTVTSNGFPGSGFQCNPPSGESFDSGVIQTGGMFEHIFNTPGTYSYHCEIHGCMMTGTVTVT